MGDEEYRNEYDNEGGGNPFFWSCCNDEQTLFILLYIAYVVLAVLTWRTTIAKPIRLIAVFIHEWCHAFACWLTCGEVRRIEVYENEGGVTTFVGGCRCIIIPAGYVGCSLWSMIFVILSGGRTTSTIGCVAFTLSLIVTLCYSPNSTLVILCLAYTVLNLVVIVLEYFVYHPLLQFLVLYYGVTVGMFSIADIHADTVRRETKGSDSHACSEEVLPCCYSRWIGVQWAILAIMFQLIGIWIALVAMSSECQDVSWAACIDPQEDGWNVWDLFGAERDFDFEGWWHQATESFLWTAGG